MKPNPAPIVTLTLLLAIAAAPQSSAVLFKLAPVVAQAAAPTPLPLPSAVPQGTTVRIDGSTSMTPVNQALRQRFEQQFPGTTVTLAEAGTPAALQALLDGRIDLAAIGRSLTPQERGQGLVSQPIGRQKIAVVVSQNNPFKGGLTGEQFARIFRGEITSWAQVGGPNAPIRMIDRPATSDTREALRNYPVFKAAPFQSGANAIRLAEDSTTALLQQLGNNGIGYAVLPQALNQSGVRIVPLNGVPPTDRRYDFSQPLAYVHQAANPSQAAQYFLGYATAPANQASIQTATTAAAVNLTAPVPASPPAETATSAPAPAATSAGSPPATSSATSPSPIASPTTALVPGPSDASGDANAGTSDGASPLWWLLLPLLGIPLLWWLLRDRQPAATATAVPAAAAAASAAGLIAAKSHENRIILVPRDCRHAYAYWEVSEARQEAVKRQGGRKLALRLFDVTNQGVAEQPPHLVEQFDCDERDPDLQIPIAFDNRDYQVELGYLTANREWLRLATSAPVHVPVCPPVENPFSLEGTALAGGTALAAGAAARSLAGKTADLSRMILVPRDQNHAYTYWELPEAEKTVLRRQGRDNLAVRLYDATGVNLDRQSPNFQQYDCADLDQQDLHLPIPAVDRDYVAELGYLTSDRRWVKLARSAPVRAAASDSASPSTQPSPQPAISLPCDRASSLSKAASELVEKTTQALTNLTGGGSATSPRSIADSEITGSSTLAGDTTGEQTALDDLDCRIEILPRDPQRVIAGTTNSEPQAYVYWTLSHQRQQALRDQGGQQLVLRVYDATNIDLDYQPAHSFRQYDCDEWVLDRVVTVPQGDRDYVAEIGYLTADGRLLRLARSVHAHIPAVSQEST
jgi:phosphate transport system substrate-binding protein